MPSSCLLAGPPTAAATPSPPSPPPTHTFLQSGIVDQLAGAIEEEIEQLGGGRLPEDALLQVAKVSWRAAAQETIQSLHLCPRGSTWEGGRPSSGSRGRERRGQDKATWRGDALACLCLAFGLITRPHPPPQLHAHPPLTPPPHNLTHTYSHHSHHHLYTLSHHRDHYHRQHHHHRHHTHSHASIHIPKQQEDSLDLSALEVNPEAPSIWFSAAGSTHQHPPSSSAGQLSEQAAAPGADATETADAAAAAASVCHEEAEEGAGQGPAARNAGQGRGAGAAPATAAHVGEGLAAASPFASAGGAAAHGAEGSTGQVVGDVGMHAGGVQLHGSSQSSTIPGMQHAAVVEAAAAAALSAVADSAAGSAHEDHAAEAAAQAGPPAGEPVPPADEAAAATVAEVAAAAAGVAGPDSEQPSGSVAVAASARLSLQKQLTVRYPVVITPSGERAQQIQPIRFLFSKKKSCWVPCCPA